MVVGSDCVDCGGKFEGIGGDLSFMGRIGSATVSHDVEEGEISDSASVEEISEADFRKQDSASADSQKLVPGSAESRVWTMRDLYNYPRYRTGLYNLAWSQAVQNKPLDDIFVMDVDPDESAAAPAVIDVSGDEMDGVEKEEGELEEGEIDLDSMSPKVAGEGSDSIVARLESDSENDNGDAGTDTLVSSILETLGSVRVIDAEKSFEEVCSKVQTGLESLRLLFSDSKFVTNNSINQMLFSAVQVVNLAFCSMNLNQKDQRKELLLRLLCSVKNCDPPLLFPEQMKEIENMISALRFIETSDNDKYTRFSTDPLQEMGFHSSTTSTENLGHELSSVKWPSLASVIHSNAAPQAGLRTGTSAFKGRGTLLPLLDLHKDHDEDSLPSPTRDAPPSFSVHKLQGVGDGVVKSVPVIAKAVTTNESKPHRYEDAFKAVTTYQQKFGRSSFLMNDMLPSPTPSEEESDEGDDDTGKEVSSFSTSANNVRAPIPSSNTSRPSLVSTSAHTSWSNPIPQAPTVVKVPAPLNTNSNPTLKASARSRDPRLRFANTDSDALDLNVRPNPVVKKPPPMIEPIEPIGLKKQRMGEEHILDGPAVKRQRNTFEHTDTMSGPTINGLNAGKDKVLAMNPLPELLKDIAVNPDILINILKSQQQRLAAEALKKSDPMKDTKSNNSILGTASLVNVTPPKGGILHTPVTSRASLMGIQNEVGTIRMKPRDPRRALLGNTNQKAGNEPLKSSAAPLPCTMMNKESIAHGQKTQEAQAEQKPMPSQTVIQPDISQLFTKNLRNIADLVSVSNTPMTQNLPSQPEKGDAKPSVSKTEDKPSAPNAWGNVEHLFEGYDEHQKAAIQKERSRRLEEQNKMFAARKLCLVLDLDHTLLNSAKFVEVDPVHEEILRKKEEQDREKPHRHLFRFPHMGMWTKLRPGIWTFLETASKLFEMHLYTMGNKLYATEMAKVLDPKGTLFSGRVISRGDDEDSSDGEERVPKSKDLEGVLGMESAVVIIDDSVRVWPHNKLNLIVVERYTYFPCSRRQFGLPGPSLLEIDHDERPEEGTLASSLSVIGKIHQNFFAHQSLDEADVRNILASEQRKILGGCRIVFSRVFPVSEVNPHLHPLWQSAEQFGAVCTTQLDEQVTHVVANSPGTDKVNWALSRGKFAVHPGWVEASALLYRRASEQDFAIKPALP